MRSSLASLMIGGSTSATPGGANRGNQAARVPAADFRGEIAAAAAVQVFADGLAEMWAARSKIGASDRGILLASISSRVDVLASLATASTDRPGAAGGFAQAASAIRDLAARRIRAADTLAPRFANLRASQAEA